MRTSIVVVALAACGAPPKPAAPVPAGPTCAGAAAHMVDEMAATMDPRPPDEALNALIGLIRSRCDQDRWSSEAVACLSKIKSAADADHCGTLLTDAQQAALVRDQEARSRPPD
jgi:hypothetical protein